MLRYVLWMCFNALIGITCDNVIHHLSNQAHLYGIYLYPISLVICTVYNNICIYAFRKNNGRCVHVCVVKASRLFT